MFGGVHETSYYFNLNTSDLSPGNYMVHAEVTFDITKNSTFGAGIKHDDKIFYIAPKKYSACNSTNYSAVQR